MFTLCLVTTVSSAEENQVTVLNMAENSIDDMYSGCSDKMANKVQQEFFPKENNVSFFQNAWESAEQCTVENLQVIINNDKDKELTINQLQAICVYTQESPNVYAPFNQAVQNDKANYTTDKFKYHALHYWLTSAIQVLSATKSCRITYRRSPHIYSGEINQLIRFGRFASSSKTTDQYYFGTETCFYIKTCYGAYLKAFSTFEKAEREVLIPPYEMFKITDITTQSYKNLEKCNKIFVLESAGSRSDLNCKAVNQSYATKANFSLILALISLIWSCFGNVTV